MASVQAKHEARLGATAGGEVAFSCTYCHGANGDNQSQIYPKLATLPADYISNQLIAYREGRRKSLSMQSMALALTDEEIKLVAGHFASVPLNLPIAFSGDQEKIAEGKLKAVTCIVCHGPGERSDPNAPPLAGQGYQYLVSQLTAYRDGSRIDTNNVMPGLVSQLDDNDIDNIAQYYASEQEPHKEISE